MNARKGDVAWVVWNGADVQLYATPGDAYAAAMDLIDGYVAAGQNFNCPYGRDQPGDRLVSWQEYVRDVVAISLDSWRALDVDVASKLIR